MPHLLIASHWELELQHLSLRGTRSFNPQKTATAKMASQEESREMSKPALCPLLSVPSTGQFLAIHKKPEGKRTH